MNLPKVIAEYLLNLKDVKKSVVFLLCISMFFIGISIYEGFIIKKEQIKIQNLQSQLMKSVDKTYKLNNKVERGYLSIVYLPKDKNKYNTSEDFFSMEKVLWNNVFNETESTIDMNNWILESTDKWEEEINKNLNLLKNVITTDEYNLLRNSQEQWEKYKTVEYKFLNKIFYKTGGNMWYTLHLLYRLKLMEDRAGTLHSLYKNACDLQEIRKENNFGNNNNII